MDCVIVPGLVAWNTTISVKNNPPSKMVKLIIFPKKINLNQK